MVLLALVLLAGTVWAQTGGMIELRLESGPDAGSEAEVRLWPGNQINRCSIPGQTEFRELAAGQYRIEVRNDRIVPWDTTLYLATGEAVICVARLEVVAATLPEVVVESRGDPHTRVFRREQIRASQARTLPEFLSRSSELEVRSDGSAGGPVTVRIGGSNANQVMVLVDGRRLQQGGSGEADLSAVPLEWVETVRVSRGSRIDQGGEAIGGVVEITTRAVGDHPELSAEGEYRATHHRLSFTRTGRSGPFYGLAAATRTQGPGDFRYIITEDDGNGAFTVDLGSTHRRSNADITRDQLLLKLGTRVRTVDLELSGTLDHAARGMPGYIAPQLTPFARQETRQKALTARVTRTLGSLSLAGRTSYQHDERRYRNTQSSDEACEQWDAGAQAQLSLRSWALNTGLSGGHETLRSQQLTNAGASRERWAAWGQAQRSLLAGREGRPKLSVEGGLRWEGFGGQQEWLPQVRICFDHQLGWSYGASIGWGRSFRAPNFYALFWLDDQFSRGNPDLLPEQSAEWTGRAYWQTGSANRTRVEAAVSDQSVENLIYWKRTFDNHWKPFNLKQARVRTLDLEVVQSLWREHVRLTAGLNWTEARDATPDRNTGGRYLTFRAPRTQRVTLELRQRGFALVAHYRAVSARPVLETNSKWLRAYQITDLSLSYTWRLRRIVLEPSVGVDNLLDEQYRLIRHAPMPGRELFASLRITQL